MVYAIILLLLLLYMTTTILIFKTTTTTHHQYNYYYQSTTTSSSTSSSCCDAFQLQPITTTFSIRSGRQQGQQSLPLTFPIPSISNRWNMNKNKFYYFAKSSSSSSSSGMESIEQPPTSSPSTTAVAEQHWTSQLRNVLNAVEEPLGSLVYYKVMKNIPFLQPDITIANNIGRIGLPLSDITINELITKVATKISFEERNKKELFNDTVIGKVWQIDASAMMMMKSNDNTDHEWAKYLNETVQRCCYNLGISKGRFVTLGIQANLSKMLIYEDGDGHFPSYHLDTEKVDGNRFGTMIIQLPTSNGYTGGAVSFAQNNNETYCHTQQQQLVDLSMDSDTKCYEMAFYNTDDDSVQSPQFHSVTTGKRVWLVYNLIVTTTSLTNNETIPNNTLNKETASKLRTIWKHWMNDGDEKICKLGYRIQYNEMNSRHEYTNFGVSSLRGQDETIFATLKNAKLDSITGKRLFNVSLLLMQWYRYEDCYESDTEDRHRPIRVVVENNPMRDESYSTWSGDHVDTLDDPFDVPDSINNEWNMICEESQNGWWILPNDKTKDGVKKIYEDEYNEDEYNEDDEDEDDDDDDDNNDGRSFALDFNDDGSDEREMFRDAYECERGFSRHTGTVKYEYFEKWYFEAAIVISPIL